MNRPRQVDRPFAYSLVGAIGLYRVLLCIRFAVVELLDVLRSLCWRTLSSVRVSLLRFVRLILKRYTDLLCNERLGVLYLAGAELRDCHACFRLGSIELYDVQYVELSCL